MTDPQPTAREREYITHDGQRIRYAPSPATADFLDELAAWLDDPARTYDDMVRRGYSRENPFLDPTPSNLRPDLGYVTPRVLALPEYRVLRDLVHRKQRRALDAATRGAS